MTTKTAVKFTVSGPDVDRQYETDGQAISAAITFAEHSNADADFYVRDESGDTVARVEHRGKSTRVLRVAS